MEATSFRCALQASRSLSWRHSRGIQGRRHFSQDDSILSRRVQIYRSTSTNPYLNLSIEHHLLQRSHPDSTVLFLYANRPCVVIGRNQNPWLEVNLRQLARGIHNVGDEPLEVALVRRRSGGGTVFHDLGNLNWSVICPSAVFNRDRHAEMVSRALRGLGVSSAHVNERHDIVVDATSSDGHVQQFKVSGSAYKVTRLRSLHHGTLLLSSPHLPHVSGLLRSPAESFIKARGVESVRSKIRNVNVGNDEFVEGVVGEFRRMYDGERVAGITLIDQDAAAETPNIAQGVRELMVCISPTIVTCVYSPFALHRPQSGFTAKHRNSPSLRTHP